VREILSARTAMRVSAAPMPVPIVAEGQGRLGPEDQRMTRAAAAPANPRVTAELARQHAFESAVLRQEVASLRFEVATLRNEAERSKEDALHVRRNVEHDRDRARADAESCGREAQALKEEQLKLEESLRAAKSEAAAARKSASNAAERAAELQLAVQKLEQQLKPPNHGVQQPKAAHAKPRREEHTAAIGLGADEPLVAHMLGGTAGGGGLDALAHALRARRSGLSGSLMEPRVRNLIIESFTKIGSAVLPHLDSAVCVMLAAGMRRQEFQAGRVIYRAGAPSTQLLFIESGEVSLCEGASDDDKDGSATVLEQDQAGSIFGLDALTLDVPFTSTAIALSKTVVWGLDVADFRIAHRWIRLEQRAHTFNMMRLLPAFAGLADRNLSKLADVAIALEVEADAIIIREGDAGDGLYLVNSGDAQVYVGAMSRTIKHFATGDYFGETSLLYDMKRTASVRALTRMSLVKVERSAFLRLPALVLATFKRNINLLEYESSGIQLPDKLKQDVCGHQSPYALSHRVAHLRAAQTDGLLGGAFSAPALHPDDLLVTNPLGVGATGRVFLAKDRRTEVLCAVKVLSKHKLATRHLAKHVANELLLMRSLQHPCLLRCCGAFHGPANVVFLVEPCLGGDLFRLIDRFSAGMPPEHAAFYAGSIVLAIGHMHAHEWIYRDLKPENILLDAHGFPRICDFGFARQITDRAYTRCGTPEYMSREMVMGEGVNEASDWWSLGVLIYELLTGGKTPFMADSNKQVYDRIIAGEYELPERLFGEAERSIVQALLQPKIADRLGYLSGGAEDIKAHPFFAGVRFEALVNRLIEPPWRPAVGRSPDGKPDVVSHFADAEALDMPTASETARAQGQPHVTVAQLTAQHLVTEEEPDAVAKLLAQNKNVPDGSTWQEYFRKHFGVEVDLQSASPVK
jgi:serine/threonine protein kinase/CRP-like cAMP-binding protein